MTGYTLDNTEGTWPQQERSLYPVTFSTLEFVKDIKRNAISGFFPGLF